MGVLESLLVVDLGCVWIVIGLGVVVVGVLEDFVVVLIGEKCVMVELGCVGGFLVEVFVIVFFLVMIVLWMFGFGVFIVFLDKLSFGWVLFVIGCCLIGLGLLVLFFKSFCVVVLSLFMIIFVFIG